MANLVITGTKGDIGLGNVDNTADVDKVVSTPQAAAIAVVQSDIDTHEARTDNPHNVTKTQVGLPNVPNTDTTNPANITQDTTHRFATDAEKIIWNAALQTISGIAAGGELSGTYPNPAILNSAVLAKVLTGLNISGSSIADTDTLLQAFGKLQSQLNGVLGGVVFQSTWNATTNSPSISDATGSKGKYYVVSVAGIRDLGSGNIDFAVGDWAIHNGTIYQKVDNTDAVSSVNGFTGAVSLTTADVAEVTNLYFTTARVLAVVLTGFSAGSNSTILATDTIAQALAKIQGQINARPNETATTIAAINHAAAPKTTLVDADELTGQDSASSFSLMRVTCLNVYNYLKSKFDSVYQAVGSYATLTGAETLTNKRLTPRILSAASYTTDTGSSLNSDSLDAFFVTAQAGALKFNNWSGTPTDGQAMIIRIKDNGTARALTYDTQYRGVGVTLPSTTVVSKVLYLGCVWNAAETKIDVIGVSQQS